MGCHPLKKDAIPLVKDAIPLVKDAIPLVKDAIPCKRMASLFFWGVALWQMVAVLFFNQFLLLFLTDY